MADTNRLNKPLWTNITRLKLFNKADKDVRFILEKQPFNDEEEEKVAAALDAYVIIGKVLPQSGIYKENGFRIEMKLTSKYPQEAPVVRLLNPVYHPNVEKDGTFCHQLLNNASRWKKGTTLVEVVEVIAKYLNEPDPDYAVNFDMAKEYVDNRDEFNRKALEKARQSCPT